MAAATGRTPFAHHPGNTPARWAKSFLVLTGMAAGCLALAVSLTAWVCDDAWFGLRSAWHLAHGYGLVFNPGERVQAFTSPLWTLLAAGPMALGLPAYPTVILLSLLCVLGLVVVLIRHGTPGPGAAALALLLLLGSKAFVDYGTSGLENPLAHLLLLGFLARWARDPHLHPRALGLLAGLLLLTRLDLGLLVLPHLAWSVLQRGGLRRLGGLLVGMLPLIGWEAFSLLYYGSPVPVTAIAKLGDAGLSRGFLIERGLAYLWEGLAWDPLTLPLLALGVALAVFGPRRTTLPTAAGALLYTGYVVWIGGDFMAGRFLSAPLAAAVFCLAWLPLWHRPRLLLPAAAAVVALMALSPRWPLRTLDPARLDGDSAATTRHQVADERMVYHDRGGLLARIEQHALVDHVDGPHDRIVFAEVAGYNAFVAGPGCHVVNPYGLGDAFVARMPADPPGQQRAGHVERRVPARYLDSIVAGENLLETPEERALLDDVWQVVRGPLLAPTRWDAIARIHGLR